MEIDPRAGLPAIDRDLVDVPKLIAACYRRRPDPGEPAQRAIFGTSGRRGTSFARIDGSVWTADKDGIVAALLAAEIAAVSKNDPGDLNAEQTAANRAFASGAPAPTARQSQETN